MRTETALNFLKIAIIVTIIGLTILIADYAINGIQNAQEMLIEQAVEQSIEAEIISEF